MPHFTLIAQGLGCWGYGPQNFGIFININIAPTLIRGSVGICRPILTRYETIDLKTVARWR